MAPWRQRSRPFSNGPTPHFLRARWCPYPSVSSEAYLSLRLPTEPLRSYVTHAAMKNQGTGVLLRPWHLQYSPNAGFKGHVEPARTSDLRPMSHVRFRGCDFRNRYCFGGLRMSFELWQTHAHATLYLLCSESHFLSTILPRICLSN